MRLTNTMERPVRSLLARLQEEASGESACWCPLCRADMIALSLSSLPPRYGRRHAADSEHVHGCAVEAEVGRAIRHVHRFPKHPRGSGVPRSEPVWVVNFPLEEGFHVVDSLLREKDSCDCWQCRCDIVAFALNRYPARYGVEHQGRTLLLVDDREKMRRELALFVGLATRVVTQLPRH